MKCIYILTDDSGAVWNAQNLTEEEAKQHNEEARLATDGNLFWVKSKHQDEIGPFIIH